MIGIKNKAGQYLELDKSTRITWVRQNPFWREDLDFETEVSYPFDVPYTLNNAAILGYPEEIQARAALTKIAGEVEFEGNLYFDGNINVIQASYNGYTISVTNGIDIKGWEKEIDKIAYAAAQTITPTLANNNANKQYPDVSFQFPEIANADAEAILNYNEVQNGATIIENYYNGNAAAFDSTTLYVPQVNLTWLIKYWCEKVLKISKVTGRILRDTDFRKLLVYSNRHLVLSKTQCLTLKVGGGAKDRGSPNFGGLYLWNEPACFSVPISTVISFTVKMSGNGSTTFDYDTVVTHTTTTIVTPLQLMDDLMNAALTADSNLSINTPVGGPLFAFSLTSVWFSTGYTYYDIVDVTVTFPALSYTYNNFLYEKHLPNITISDAMAVIKDWFCLAMVYDCRNNTLAIENRGDLLSDEVTDYTPKLNGVLTTYVEKYPNYYITWLNDDTDLKVPNIGQKNANNYPEYNQTPQTTVEIQSGTCWQESVRNSNSGFGDMPSVQQPIIDYASTEEHAAFRLIKYEGLKNNTNGIAYPKATTQGLMPNESFITYWRKWYTAYKYSGKRMEGDFDFTIGDLLAFEPKHKWMVENNAFAWQEMSTDMTMNGLEQTRVILKRI